VACPAARARALRQREYGVIAVWKFHELSSSLSRVISLAMNFVDSSMLSPPVRASGWFACGDGRIAHTSPVRAVDLSKCSRGVPSAPLCRTMNELEARGRTLQHGRDFWRKLA